MASVYIYEVEFFHNTLGTRKITVTLPYRDNTFEGVVRKVRGVYDLKNCWVEFNHIRYVGKGV